MINHICPHCNREMSNSDAAAGWEVACPHCRRSVPVPMASTITLSVLPGAAESAPAARPAFETERQPGKSRRWMVLVAIPFVAAGLAWLLAGSLFWLIPGFLTGTFVAGTLLGVFRRLLNGIRTDSREMALIGYGILVVAIWFSVGYWFQVGTIHVDNFSDQNLRIVVDDQPWGTFRSTSTDVKTLKPGHHRIVVFGTGDNKLDELNVNVDRMGVYVLNLLRAQKYHKGSAQYGGFAFGGDRPIEVDDAWFSAKVDFLFENPPESITVSTKRGQPAVGASRTYLKRGPAPSEEK